MFDTITQTPYNPRMSQQPTPLHPSNTPEQPPTAEGGDDIAYFKRVLLHLVEIGDELAEMVRQEARQSAQAQAEAAKRNPDPQIITPIVVPPHIKDAFDLITRSVRRSMVLYQKLKEPQKASPAYNRVAARKKIIRDVEDTIQSRAPQGQEENLHAELAERLERPEFDDELANRSIAEIVTEICRDLGIGGLHSMHPWKRRMPRDIAILQARAEQLYGQAPSAELAALLGHQNTQRVSTPDDS
jgi:hypothetical protein